MANVRDLYTGDGTTVLFSLSFEYLDQEDVKATINGVPTTAFGFVNASTIQFASAPANGAFIRIFRETPIDQAKATFFAGSAIRASDLNQNNTQLVFSAQESNFISTESSTLANSALTIANAADGKADTAIIDSAAAVATANQADINAAAAVITANAAESNSLSAVATANSAAAAVSSAVFYRPVIDLAALALLTPADGEFFELQNSTGAESDPLITGVPVGLVGDPDLSFRLRYEDPPGEYVFIEYFSTDPENRYIRIGAGAIVDADVNASAAIAYSKLALAGSVVDADVNASAAIAYSKLALAGSVVDADIDASAAIAGTKISPDFGSQNVVTNGTIRLSGSTSGYTELTAPAVAGNNTVTLPDGNGTAGQVLQTNGSGELSWFTIATEKIEKGNTSAEVIDTGTDGRFVVTTEGVEALRVDDIGDLAFNSGYGSAATAYGCRAWVNFNGTTAGTNPAPMTIRASGNVSSVTRDGTGRYTVNFTTAMPDDNYAVGGSAAGSGSRGSTLSRPSGATQTTTACGVFSCELSTSSTALANVAVMSVYIFR